MRTVLPDSTSPALPPGPRPSRPAGASPGRPCEWVPLLQGGSGGDGGGDRAAAPSCRQCSNVTGVRSRPPHRDNLQRHLRLQDRAQSQKPPPAGPAWPRHQPTRVLMERESQHCTPAASVFEQLVMPTREPVRRAARTALWRPSHRRSLRRPESVPVHLRRLLCQGAAAPGRASPGTAPRHEPDGLRPQPLDQEGEYSRLPRSSTMRDEFAWSIPSISWPGESWSCSTTAIGGVKSGSSSVSAGKLGFGACPRLGPT